MSLDSSFSSVKVLGDFPSSLKAVICTSKESPYAKLKCICLPHGTSSHNYADSCTFQKNGSKNNAVFQLTFTDIRTNKKWIALADQWDNNSSHEGTLWTSSPSETERQACSLNSSSSPPFSYLILRKNGWKEEPTHFFGNDSALKSSSDAIAGENTVQNDKSRLLSGTSCENEVFKEDKQLPILRRDAYQEKKTELIGKEYRWFLLNLLHFLAPQTRSNEEVTKWFYDQQFHNSRALENQIMNFAEVPANSADIDSKVLDFMLQRWTYQEHKHDSIVDDSMCKNSNSDTFSSIKASVNYNLVEEGFLYIDLDRYDKDDIQLKRQVANRCAKAFGALKGTRDLAENLCPYADFDVLLSSRGGIIAGLKGGKGISEELLSGLHLGHSSLKDSRKRLRAYDTVKKDCTAENEEVTGEISLDSFSYVQSHRAIYTTMDQCLIPWSQGDLSLFCSSLKHHPHDESGNKEKENLAFPKLLCTEEQEKGLLASPVFLSTDGRIGFRFTNQIYAGHLAQESEEQVSQIWKYFFIPKQVISSSAQLHESLKDAQSLAKQYLTYRRILLDHAEVTLKAAAWREKYGTLCRCSASLNDELEAWWKKQQIPRIALEQHLLSFHERLYHFERDASEYFFMHSLFVKNCWKKKED